MNTYLSNSLVLDGYRLIRFLGRGGFGEVWLCQSEAMGDFRALKFIPITHADRLEKEYAALLHYRKAAAQLRSPHLVPIEHVNRNDAGLYYVMPLADGATAVDPADPAWSPVNLATAIHERAEMPVWFSSKEIIALIRPVLDALQTLSDAGLVHRDVKPENILFFNGQPCLGDISLLGADASVITRRGTPGYATPSWYVGGHPDMYGVAATLYALLTGNSPDKMGRAAFIWPPQGERSLSEAECGEWKRLHAVIRRACDERVSERFTDFRMIADALQKHVRPSPKLPRIIATSLALVGVAAGTMVAAFRSKQPDVRDTTGKKEAAKDPLPELTQEQTADYQALAGMIQGYIGEGQYANALASVETLLSTYPQSRTQPAYSIARAMALRGLGRIEEAKVELRKEVHLSPQIPPMAARKGLWEEFGDLPSAEQDLTRVLDKFGPNTFVLFLRADVRAQRGNFPGVLTDKQAAYACNPKDESEQKRLVGTMWAPLESKYPGYADYLKTAAVGEKSSEPVDRTLAEDSPLLKSLDDILRDYGSEMVTTTPASIDATNQITRSLWNAFQRGDDHQALELLAQIHQQLPALADDPRHSAFKALLLQRLWRNDEANQELSRPSNAVLAPKHAAVRARFLIALGKGRDAEDLLSRMIAAVPSTEDEYGADSMPLLAVRAEIRASLGDFAGTLADRHAAESRIPPEPPDDGILNLSVDLYSQRRQRTQIQKAWAAIEASYPGYADYVKAQPGK
jgi:serine/threonine protein kinase